MSKKLYTSEELNNPIVDEEAPTIQPRLPGEHHKPGHKPSESINPTSLGKSQDADRHRKVRHEDSKK